MHHLHIPPGWTVAGTGTVMPGPKAGTIIEVIPEQSVPITGGQDTSQRLAEGYDVRWIQLLDDHFKVVNFEIQECLSWHHLRNDDNNDLECI